jgi:glycosyltransferase involved in cell wall biosynthesis
MNDTSDKNQDTEFMYAKRSNASDQLHIVFLHLDLGIGGAEQLVINLALASFSTDSNKNKGSTHNNTVTEEEEQKVQQVPSLNARVSILTTYCNQNHCFDAVRKTSDPPGILASSVHVVGSFLPVTLFGMGTAFCSTIRMFYLSFMARKLYPNADVIVLDGLPSPIPYLVVQKKSNCVIYYCHFPDKLLTRDTVNGDENYKISGRMPSSCRSSIGHVVKVFLKTRYRKILDQIEEWSMSYADLVCVNSQFTRKQVLSVFPSLDDKLCQSHDKMKVLYPAIDLNKFVPPDFDAKQKLLTRQEEQSGTKMPIVSLNRFERKKNIGILLHAYASMVQDSKSNDPRSTMSNIPIPQLIIAGGYDPRNMENVEYLKELKDLAKKLGIENQTVFKPSVSDEERAMLLKSAICVVYTPHREHFGIVPLEAMYAGSAVVAMKSGGPEETVQDGVTGILVDMTPEDTCEKLKIAICSILQDPKKAIEMGKCGHNYVKNKFGLVPFRQEWTRLVLQEAIPRGKERLRRTSRRSESYDSRLWSVWLCVACFGIVCSWFWIGYR